MSLHVMHLPAERLQSKQKKFEKYVQPKSKGLRPIAMSDHSELEPNDQALIHRVLDGDDSAYQLLIERYQNLVWSLLNRMVTNTDDREELAQDVFLKAYFKLKQFRFESKFSTWLYTIAYRSALSFLRKSVLVTEPLEEQPESADETFVLEDFVAGVQLKGALDRLAIEDRTVITLYHLHSCSIEEIGTIMSKPEGTVKNQLFRARRKLKTMLEQEA